MFESNEKMKRALPHDIRATESRLIKNGDNICYKRNGEHEWHGPGVVIVLDGKLFLVRRGGILIFVHEYSLLKASNGDAGSCSVDNLYAIFVGAPTAAMFLDTIIFGILKVVFECLLF